MKSPKISIHRGHSFSPPHEEGLGEVIENPDNQSKFTMTPSNSPSRGGERIGGTGFTLVEILIVMGLISMIAAFGLFISMDVYRGNTIHSEKNIIISILQKARSRAVNNINEERHGVRFDANQYVIFQGDTCSASGEDIPRSSNITNTGGCVVFNQLTGERDPVNSTISSLTINGQGFSSTITINDQGRISW